MNYAELIASSERLLLLQCLGQAHEYTLNESVLFSLFEQLGQSVSRDKLRSLLAWLDEQGLINITKVAGVTVAKLTARGADVAKGRTTVPGVKRPDPED